MALATCEVILGHEVGSPTELTIATAEPGRDERLWLDQLRLRLESLGGMRPVTWLQVVAGHFVTPPVGQGSLFLDEGERDRDERSLCHRLRARLGDASVARLQRLAGLVPSSCSRLQPLGGAEPPEMPEEAAGRFRPLWWLDGPRHPEAPVRQLMEVERVETAWWSAAEEAADYCAGELTNGRAVCLRRERRRDEWQLIGFED